MKRASQHFCSSKFLFKLFRYILMFCQSNFPAFISYTTFQAWSTIVYSLIPNVIAMEEKLKQFATAVDADEVCQRIFFSFFPDPQMLKPYLFSLFNRSSLNPDPFLVSSVKEKFSSRVRYFSFRFYCLKRQLFWLLLVLKLRSTPTFTDLRKFLIL